MPRVLQKKCAHGRGPPISVLDPLDASLMGARYLAVVSRGACIREQGLLFAVQRALHFNQCSTLGRLHGEVDLSRCHR